MCKVSVIIPTYGEPVFLEKAILSVRNQTMSEWELIVVDDNNPNTEAREHTSQILDRYRTDTRIRYLQHEHNKNGAAARNTGIAVAKGEYIAFLDSDDEYFPKRLQACCEAMECAKDKIAGVYTGCEFRRDGKMFHTERNIHPGNFLVETLACTFMFCTGSNLFIRRSVIEEVNGFDESFLRHQDYEFLVRIFVKYDLAAIQDTLVIKNNENINVPDVEKIRNIKEQYLQKYKEIIESLPREKQVYIYKKQYIQIAELALRTRKSQIAKEYYKKVNQLGGLSVKEWLRKLAFSLIKKKV